MKETEQYTLLVADAQAGDHNSMGHLAVIVRDRLYPHIFKTTMSHDRTEDILQETLLAMLRRIGSLRRIESFWPWIRQIAHSQIQESFRKQHRRTAIHTRARHTGWWAFARPEDERTAIEAISHKESLEQLTTAVGKLSRIQRDILYLRCYERLPYTRIAKVTRSTPTGARTGFYRAKQLLKTRLKACCSFSTPLPREKNSRMIFKSSIEAPCVHPPEVVFTKSAPK